MPKFNELLPITQVIHLGSSSGAKTFPGIHFPKKSRIVSAHLLDGSGIASQAGSNTKLELKNGSDVIGVMDTTPGQEGAVTANVGKAFTIDEDLSLVDALSDLTVVQSEVEGVQEVTRITVPALMVGADLDGKGFLMADELGTVDFWFDVDNGGTTEPAGLNASGDRGVEINTIGAADDAEAIAAKLVTAIDADAKFAAVIDPDDATSLLVTVSTVGAKADVADGTAGEASGLTLAVETQGVASVAQALTNAKVCVSYYPL